MKHLHLNISPLFRSAKSMGKHMVIYILLVWVVPLFSDAPGPTQMEISVDEDIQVPILLNVLTFDRNLKPRVGHRIVLGIIYQEKFRQSLNSKNEVEQYLQKSKPHQIDGIPLHVVPIDFLDIPQLKSTLEAEKVNILYITPLRAVSIVEIASLCKTLKIISLTGVADYCNDGIVVGIGSKGGNPVIIINLAAANATGADFSSRLLKLAKVINLPSVGE